MTVAFVLNTITQPINCTVWNVCKDECLLYYTKCAIIYLKIGGSSLILNCIGQICIVEDLNFGAPS